MNFLSAIARVGRQINYLLIPMSFRIVLAQLIEIGFYSISIVSITSLFTGFVLVLQTYYALSRTGIDGYIGSVVVLSMTRELGPVLTSMVVSNRVGGSITAEFGSMKVTEQIDAMKTLNMNIFSYLIQPRIIASIITFPILCFMSSVIAIIGGYLCVLYLNISEYTYLNDVFLSLKYSDVMVGLFKSFIFGFVSTCISIYYGLNTELGSNGVGLSVTKTIVQSSISILVLNCFLTWLFLNI